MKACFVIKNGARPCFSEELSGHQSEYRQRLQSPQSNVFHLRRLCQLSCIADIQVVIRPEPQVSRTHAAFRRCRCFSGVRATSAGPV